MDTVTENAVKIGTEVVNKANGNVKVIVISAVGTLAVVAGGTILVKKVRKTVAEKKIKKDEAKKQLVLTPVNTEEAK